MRMTLTEKNIWWRTAFKKEAARQTNHPVAPKRWDAPTNFRNFAPQERHARRRRNA